MQMRCPGLLAAIALTTCVTLAQERPDFSGRWTTEPDPATTTSAAGGRAAGQPGRGAGPGRGGLVAEMGSGWGPTITIAQTPAQLTVEYVFFGRGDMQPPLRFTYALDGSETKNSVFMGRGRQLQSSRTSWKGSSLVITTVHTLADPTTGKPMTADVTQTLSLESPASLVVETNRAGVFGGPATTSKTMYRRLQ